MGWFLAGREGGLRALSVFQRNEAAQDVPVALVTKLFLFFFFAFLFFIFF